MDASLRGEVPPRAALLSLLSLAIPLTGSFILPELTRDLEILLWVLALVPAFLLAYYRGWHGVATALAGAMAVLALMQVVAVLVAQEVESGPVLGGALALYILVALGAGSISELLRRARSRAEALALTDEATALPNRRSARLFLKREFGAAQRGRPVTVALFDLDGFSEYERTAGQRAAEEVLRAFARILRSQTRTMNLAARYGDDEFMAVLSGGDISGTLVFAKRVRTAVAALHSGSRTFTVSVGIAAYHPDMKSHDELLGAAERALDRAKWNGGNGVSVFDATPDVTSGARERLIRARAHLQRAEDLQRAEA